MKLKLVPFLLVIACLLGGCSSKQGDDEITPPEPILPTTQYTHETVNVAYDPDIFSIVESPTTLVFKMDQEFACLYLEDSNAKEFTHGLANMMTDPDTLSKDIADVFFWEALAPYYRLSIAETDVPNYQVFGIGTQDLDKDVSSCFATFKVDAYKNYPSLTFEVQIIGSETEGKRIISVQEDSMEMELIEELRGLKSSVSLSFSEKGE